MTLPPTETPTAVPTQVVLAGLDRLDIDGNVIWDSSDRIILLRGFVTLTHNTGGSPVNYTSDDYQQMRLLGANYQSIRIFSVSIGGWPDASVSPLYLQRLDRMVAMGKQEGIYSEFKLTMSGIQGFDWTDLWLNENGEQEAIIKGWRVLWERYKDEPSIFGYDLLNEPDKGNIDVSDEQFVVEFLIPFYQKMIDELRKIDQTRPALIQPALGEFDLNTGNISYLPFNNNSIDRANVVYAPHFYTDLLNFGTGNYSDLFNKYAAEATLHNAPLFIGEFGVPWRPTLDGNATAEALQTVAETAALDLFDQAAIGFSRPWYSDDKAGVTVGSTVFSWALISGTSGLDGVPRDFIFDVLIRPYPRRTAGILGPLSYDADSKKFAVSYAPILDSGDTIIFIPQVRQYVDGFTVTHSLGITLRLGTSSPVFDVISNPGGVDESKFSWDQADQVLSITEWQGIQTVTVEIEP